MIGWLLRRRKRSTSTEVIIFHEVIVPLMLRNAGIVRNFKPSIGKFRLYVDEEGYWYIFPKRMINELSQDHLRQIKEFTIKVRHDSF